MKQETISEKTQRRRREAIVMTAAQLFLERGLEPVKMTDIAEAAGVGVASLYRYFGTRTALAVETGTLLWKDVQALADGEFGTPAYAAATGLAQVETQLRFLLYLWREQGAFLQFLDSLDRLILAERVPEEALRAYEDSIVDLREPFRRACGKGVGDGTIRPGLDFPRLYLTVTHAVTCLGQKFLRGPVLPGEDYARAEEELRQLVEMTLFYMRRNDHD